MHKSRTNGTHSTLGRCQEMQLTGAAQIKPEQEIQLEMKTKTKTMTMKTKTKKARRTKTTETTIS